MARESGKDNHQHACGAIDLPDTHDELIRSTG